jgi:hypothetical protein
VGGTPAPYRNTFKKVFSNMDVTADKIIFKIGRNNLILIIYNNPVHPLQKYIIASSL